MGFDAKDRLPSDPENEPEIVVTAEMLSAAWYAQGILTHAEMKRCLEKALEKSPLLQQIKELNNAHDVLGQVYRLLGQFLHDSPDLIPNLEQWLDNVSLREPKHPDLLPVALNHHVFRELTNDALEDAARVCDTYPGEYRDDKEYPSDTSAELAARIRNLKKGAEDVVGQG